MVNAAAFPGPALWQGLMFCLLPFVVAMMFAYGGRYIKHAIFAYALAGVLLAVVIVKAGP